MEEGLEASQNRGKGMRKPPVATRWEGNGTVGMSDVERRKKVVDMQKRDQTKTAVRWE